MKLQIMNNNNGNTSNSRASSLLSLSKSNNKKRQGGGTSKIMWIVICFLSSVLSFYAGICIGYHFMDNNTSTLNNITPSNNIDESKLRLEISNLKAELLIEKNKNKNNSNNTIQPPSKPKSLYNSDLFDSKHTGKFISGMNTMVNRNEFAKKYDVGVPLDESKLGNDHVVLLYNDPKTFPTTTTSSTSSKSSESGNIASDDVDIATENCDIMNIILTQPNDGRKQCIAIMGQYESFHIQKLMRLPPLSGSSGRAGTGINSTLPLRIVNRGMQMNGRRSIKPPNIEQTKQHWDNLIPYLQSIDTVLNDLKPILEEVASHNQHNTIIVLVCNFGQSELLMNFVCNARAKGLSELLKNIILFATDEETLELGQFLGITTYYSKEIFELMPKNAARAYADKTFKAIMAAKVYCVHLVSQLGYNILYQDVDVIWYKNPLPWFHNTSNPYYNFDMYYQDDGNHALYYAPYSANTGFYFIRNNLETQYFFNALLMNSDLIIATSSHQIALISLLNEHTSMYGLKVKIWERNLDEFPGGYTFHYKKDYMKKLMNNEVHPYIFHMSWTKNKNDKVLFYEQLGEWYLQDTCQGITKAEIDMTFVGKKNTGANIDHCCSTTPFVNCHYKDKPSKIPCKDSEPIDKNGRSFW